MTPFKTTPDQLLHLASIMVEMKNAGVDHELIVSASELARVDQGVYDLMALWMDASSDPSERDEIIADLQGSLDDYADAPQEPVHKPYIKYDRLEDVGQRILAEKSKLRGIVDRHGGVSAVAQKSGIPQPSLSRMLNSASIPRRSTLYKIANALGLSEEDIVMEWSRGPHGPHANARHPPLQASHRPPPSRPAIAEPMNLLETLLSFAYGKEDPITEMRHGRHGAAPRSRARNIG